MAACASPRAMAASSAGRPSTWATTRKLPVFWKAAIRSRLSGVRDSSSTTVGRFRTSVWMAYPKTSSWMTGMPIIIPKVRRSRRIWMNSLRNIGQKRGIIARAVPDFRATSSSSPPHPPLVGTALVALLQDHERVLEGAPAHLRRDFGRRSQGDEVPPAHHRQPRALFRLVHVMGGDEDRRPRPGQVVDRAPEPAAGGGIHARRGLVEKQQGRLVDQRARQREPLLPAPGELPGELAETVPQREQGDDLAEPRPRRAPAQAIDARVEIEILGDRQVFVHPDLLSHVADPLLDLLGRDRDVDSGDQRRPG